MNKSAYLLIVALTGCAVIVICLLLPDQVAQPMRKATLGWLGPLLRVGEKPVHYISRMDGKLKTLDEAQVEITRLHTQVAELTLQNQLLADKKAENDRLREMLGFRQASKYHLRACRVVSREPSSWWDTVQVNIGWQDEPNLAKDQPVVSPRGVVGKTGTVSQYVTDVILMVNENCSISGKVEDPNKAPGQDADAIQDQGIVQGQGNLEEGKPRVKVKYLPKNSRIAVGQFIVTSGLGPYFPPGLRLGTVVEVPPVKNEYPTFGLYREALIEPTADLNQLDELFVVLASNTEAKPEEKKDAAAAPDAGSPEGNR